jgi:1,2-diacylglycerol 3-beta-glucosyltransferase
MVIELLAWICATLLLAVSALAVYQWVLAAAALSPVHGGRRIAAGGQRSRLLVLIPAYNEEGGLAATLSSLERVDYPRQLTRVIVIADRCEDATAAVARNHGVECLERSSGLSGKGAAIAWAMSELRRAGAEFEGLVLVDADTIVDPGALAAFDEGLRSGHDVQQGYNYLSNPRESPFTRIIAVTSVLRNALFYGGKERLGLSSMLSGSGMCFSDRVLTRNAWAAFSVGEDW